MVKAPLARETIRHHGYIPHIRQRGEEREEKKRDPSFRPCRWVVEIALAWLNRFRKLLVR
ncbi:transposase, IS4 [Leptospirillum ferriphilum ML-04]|nr:transposase, IS4 [Leptospirillum ferriphilum ML-04]